MLEQNISPMLAYSARPFDSPRHIYEIKWDGTRCILFVKPGGVRLQNRRLIDITHRYPEFEEAYQAVRARNAVVDGELVVLREGKSDFGMLQEREQVTDPFKIRLMARRRPATYMAFDLLYMNDRVCTHLPLRQRKSLLSRCLNRSGHLLESQHVTEKGIAFFQKAVAQGLEGVMAKAAESPYLMGKRSRYWLKMKPRQSAVCTVIGYTPGKGSRKYLFGSLVVATREEEQWVYRGRVGSGLTAGDMVEALARLQELRVEAPPAPSLSPLKGIQWVAPELRCRVVFQEYTSRGRFRAPVFKEWVR